MKLLIATFRKYWLTILGSFILVGSWYFEKVLIAKHESAIDELKERRLHYVIQQEAKVFSSFVSEITEFNYRHDTILNLASLIDAYTAELRMIEYLKAAGKEMQMDLNESRSELNQEYDNNITLINKLQSSNDIKEVTSKLKAERANVYEMTKNNQFSINKLIIDENIKIGRIHFWILFLYGMGIILLTMDKVKVAIVPKK